ncbi:helix-turn-helix domain-containing protein [Streptomyces sp. NPDC057682]|uniref:helix-turn-helix domain-containing protein n=1 Tax=Streptomyces sp. NPDC057682 TaxID=3346210 RepID=UPI0036BCE671
MVRASRGEMTPGMWRREAGTVMRRAGALPERSGASGASSAVVAEFRVVPAPTEWPPHAHHLHELVWVRGGTLTSRVGDRVFTVFEGHGLWMPAGVVHAGRATGGARFHDAFFAPDRTPIAFGEPKAIEMTPLLTSLLTHLARTDLDEAARLRAESVVFDVIRPSEHQLALRLPGDPRIDAIAEALLDDPADGRSLEDWARELGSSDRTVTRAFRRTTGLSFAQWRQMLRVHRALMLLSDGWDVTSVSESLGYAQPSTFIAAFRRVMGTTPGAFFGAADPVSGRTPESMSP